MPELKRLHADHAPAVLAFEVANRAYFAASISDRGDDFFHHFTDRFASSLAEQEAGMCALYVLVAEDGAVLGRFNLFDIQDHTAVLGYRVAQHVAGHGVATATVQQLCRLASTRHGLHTLRAATSHQNAASQKVLTKAGFVLTGPADPAQLGGKAGTWYQRALSSAGTAAHGSDKARMVGSMLESQRERVPLNDGGELDTTLAFLSFARSCVLKKIDGLDEEQLRRRLVPSDTTLLGLVQHLTDAERYWFGYTLGGDERHAHVDFDMVVAPDRRAADVVADYRAAIVESDAHIRAAGDPDARTAKPVRDAPRTLRWLLAHLSSETVRHAGHADVLRELIDGVTGR